MTEEFAQGLVDFFQNKIPNELIIFLVSLLPVLELRGGMIAAKLLHVDFWRAFAICYLGNILPIPFILLFIRKIFQFLRDKPVFSKIIKKLEIRSMRNSEKVKRWRDWGLLLFVAIPLPGTGGSNRSTDSCPDRHEDKEILPDNCPGHSYRGNNHVRHHLPCALFLRILMFGI